MQSMVWIAFRASPPDPHTPLSSSATPITYRFAVLRKKVNESGAGCRCHTAGPRLPERASGGVAALKRPLPCLLERIDEVFDLIGVEPPGSFRFEAYDLEERVLEDLKTTLQREDDLEPAEDAVRDTDKVPVDGREREDLVCGRDVSLVHLDLEDRRRNRGRVGVLFFKTAGDPDLRGCSSSGSG